MELCDTVDVVDANLSQELNPDEGQTARKPTATALFYVRR
jgi:hypothetical protein